ncbi:MAG: large conductance mechanosensitive channel protein MscL [Acidobacteriota bacterium]
MSTWGEFKAFAFKGNVVDLAVALVIGAAFTKIVTTLSDAVILPLFSKLVPTGSYATWAPGGIKLGLLIASIIEFLVIAFALFVVVTWLKKRRLLS